MKCSSYIFNHPNKLEVQLNPLGGLKIGYIIFDGIDHPKSKIWNILWVQFPIRIFFKFEINSMELICNMDNIYYQSEISRTSLKEFNLFVDSEYNTIKINIKNIILKSINEQFENTSTHKSNNNGEIK